MRLKTAENTRQRGVTMGTEGAGRNSVECLGWE